MASAAWVPDGYILIDAVAGKSYFFELMIADG
jgi:hypothetical protein